MAFSSMFSTSSVTKESARKEEAEENEEKTENEAEEQEEVNEDERDSREKQRSKEEEMNDNDKRNNEEENAVQQNPSYQPTATASQPPHTSPSPSTASGGGAGEGQRVEVRVNPLPKPPRVSQVPEGRPTDSKETISSASVSQSTPAGQEGSKVVLEQSEDREEVKNGVLGEGSEGRRALLKGEGVKESEEEEILVKKLNEESEGVINDYPAFALSLLRDTQKEEEEKEEQEEREREKEEENSEIKEDKSSHKNFQHETVKDVKEDKRKEENTKEEDKEEGKEEYKEQAKDSYSQLVTTMRLDRSFTLDTHAPSSAPSSELSSPSDEVALHSPTSPSSPKSPYMHSPTLENTKSPDNEEDKKEESWASDVFSDSEEQFEKLYNELSKTLNQPSQSEDEIYNSNGNTEIEESSVVTPEEPQEKPTLVTPEEPKEDSTIVTPNEPKEEITVVPLKESDSTPQKTELKRTNSIIKRRDGDGSQSNSSSNKKVQFDPNVQSIDLPPDPPLHDLPQVKENGEARPGVTLTREKTGKNTTQVKANDSVVTKARKIEENRRKTSPGPSSPVRKKPQVSSPVKTRAVTSGDGVTKKREGTVRTPSPVSPSSPSKTVRKTETEDKKTKKAVSEDKTKKTVSEDKTKKVERKEEIKKVGKDEKTEDKPGKKEEAKKATDKEEKTAIKKAEQEENKAKTRAEDTKKTIDSKTKEEKTQTKIKTEVKEDGRKTTTTISTTTTTIKQLTSKAAEVKGSGPVSNVKRQSTVDLQAPLVISGQVEMGGSIGGRLNARRVEVRDGHVLAFISHASTPSSRLPLAGLSVTPMLGGGGGGAGGGGGGGASLILTRASRCMMVLKLRSREEMMHWIHTLSDEVLRVTPEENLKGLTLYPSPEQKEEEKEEEETHEEKKEEKEEEEGSGGRSTLKEEGENVTKEEERRKEEEEQTEEESEVEEKEEKREEPKAENKEEKEESSDESLKKEDLTGTIPQRKQEKPMNEEEKATKDNHSLPSQPQRKQEESPKENGEVERDSNAKKRIITSPHFMEHLNKFREQQKTEVPPKRAGKNEDDEMNTEGRKSVNRKTGNKLDETISNKIAALIKEAEERGREAGREKRESVAGRGGRKAGRGPGEERDTKAGTEEAGKEGRRELVGGTEGEKARKVAEEERDTKTGAEEDGEGTEGSDTGGEIQVEIRKLPGRNKDGGRIGGLTHPPLRRLSGQSKSPSASPLPSPLASPRVGEDVVDNCLLVNILPEKAPPTTITTTTTTAKATTATTTTTTSTTTTTTPKSVHHTTTATSKRTPPHTTTHHHHNHHSTTTTPPTNRHANCFKPNDPISSFNRSISVSNTSLTHDEGRKAQTEVLKRSTSDIEINKGRKEGSLTRKGAVKIKNTGNRTSKRDRERMSEGDVSESINTAGTTLSSVISSRILAAKNIEIIERKDRKGSESEDTEDKENETWQQEEHKRAMNVSLRKGGEERGERGKQGEESNITWSVAATREKFELLCSVSGENKGKLTTKTPISRRRSTRLSQKRRRTQELNSTTPRRQGSVRRSFIATEDDQRNEKEGFTRQRSVQSRAASIEIEDITTAAEGMGVEKGAMRRLGGLSNSTTSQDEEYNQSTQKESARRQGSWPTRDTVQEARKAFERYSTRTTTPTTEDKAARYDSGIQKEKLTAKKSPLSRTQNILQGSPMSISVSGHEEEEFRSASPPPFTRSSALQSRNDDVVICWRGPYIAQESEQEVLNNISNAFLAKRRLLNKEVAMGRLQGRLHLLEEHLWGLQARLATEEQVAGGDRKSVERALRSVEEEIDHVTARLSVVQKEAHQAREKLASALATGLSQWCDKTGLTPRSSLTRRGKEHHHQQEEEEEEEEEYMEEESEA